MNRIIIILLLCQYYLPILCKGQVRDSVTILDFTKKQRLFRQGIRPIDSASFDNYNIKSTYFQKRFLNDSLYVSLTETSCLKKNIFLGEYTSKDSIHFIDFVTFYNPSFHVSLGGICGDKISRDHLPQIKKITIHSSPNKFTFSECDLYIQKDSAFVNFKVKGSSIPKAAIELILTLKKTNISY